MQSGNIKTMRKVRKQVYLNPWQDEQLARLASKSGLSEAEIIRNALDAYLIALGRLPSDHPLSSLAAIGASSAGGLGASRHDQISHRSQDLH